MVCILSSGGATSLGCLCYFILTVEVFSHPFGCGYVSPVCAFSFLFSFTLCLLGSCKLPTGGAHQRGCCRDANHIKEQRSNVEGGSLPSCSRLVLGVAFKFLSVECGANFYPLNEHLSIQ